MDRPSIFGSATNSSARVGGQAEEAPRPGTEFGEFLGVHRVVEREHRHAMAQLGEAALGGFADRSWRASWGG